MTTLVPGLWNHLADLFEQEGRTPGGMIRLEDHITDTEYTVKAELPGLDPEKDVQIHVSGGVLTIHAERKEETHARQRTEFRYGMMQRSVRLPANADEDAVRARYANGILEVTVPLKAAPTDRLIGNALTKVLMACAVAGKIAKRASSEAMRILVENCFFQAAE